MFECVYLFYFFTSFLLVLSTQFAIKDKLLKYVINMYQFCDLSFKLSYYRSL